MPIRVESRRDADRVMLQVTDSGEGVPPERLLAARRF